MKFLLIIFMDLLNLLNFVFKLFLYPNKTSLYYYLLHYDKLLDNYYNFFFIF